MENADNDTEEKGLKNMSHTLEKIKFCIQEILFK
jgi:hypothetical protein